MSDAKPTFGLSVVARDVDASIAFYRALGVPIPEEANWRSHHVGIPINGGISISTASSSPRATTTTGTAPA
jgi:hypothetical protein